MYAVICFDRPGSAILRDANRDAHMAYLEVNVDKIEFAGPLKDDENAPSTGAIFILNVPNRDDAENFMNGDAFNKAGVYESVVIRSFRKVFPQ